MKRDGKWLEELLITVEKSLGSANVSVESRVREFNAQGNQIAEFDIIVRGKIGSVDINALIECRDRPSGGAAPGSWIEQLIGRQHRFGFGKVIAVSSTGFSPSAIEAAERGGIELRNVLDVTGELVASWLTAFQFSYFLIKADLLHAEISLGNRTRREARSAFEKMLTNGIAKDLQLQIAGEPDFYYPRTLFSRFADLPAKVATVHAKERKPVDILLKPREKGIILFVKTDKGPAFVSEIRYTVLYRHEEELMTRSYTRYEKNDSNSLISETVIFANQPGPDHLKMEITFVPDKQ